MTVVSFPQPPQMHCSLLRRAGNDLLDPFQSVCRPGCLRRSFCAGLPSGPAGGGGTGSRSLSLSLSAWTSSLDTPGSSSSNCSCKSLNFSLALPYFAMRARRRRSSNRWIFTASNSSNPTPSRRLGSVSPALRAAASVYRVSALNQAEIEISLFSRPPASAWTGEESHPSVNYNRKQRPGTGK